MPLRRLTAALALQRRRAEERNLTSVDPSVFGTRMRVARLVFFALLAMVGLQPVRAASYALGADVSGTFFDPAQDGHGMVVEHIVSNGEPALLVTWFTYLDGQQHWLVGVGPVSGKLMPIVMSACAALASSRAMAVAVLFIGFLRQRLAPHTAALTANSRCLPLWLHSIFKKVFGPAL